VRLGALPANEAFGAPSSQSDSPALDALVAACRAAGLFVWAEVSGLAPRIEPAAAVSLVDDPSSAEEWIAAVEELLARPGGTERLMLAAAWDPRLEVVLQRHVRAWGRSFNPETGLRRCEDPAFFLFSFSSRWEDEMTNASREPLPGFFEQSLALAWNTWLWDRFGSDGRLSVALGPLPPGESVSSNTVAFPPLDPSDHSRSPAFRDHQKMFLRELYAEHMQRVVDPFTLLGPASRVVPRFVSQGAGKTISALSTIAFAKNDGAAGAAGETGDGGKPTIWFCERLGAVMPLVEQAENAAKFGADVLLVPFDPEGDDEAAAAAAVFLADAAGFSGDKAPPSGLSGLELPDYVDVQGSFFKSDSTNAPASVVALQDFGAHVAFVTRSGSDAMVHARSFASSTNALPLVFVVHVRPGANLEKFDWRLRAFRAEPDGTVFFSLRVSGSGTEDLLDYGLLVGGSSVAKKSLSPSGLRELPDSGASALPWPLLPSEGMFVVQVTGGADSFELRPVVLAPAILRNP
jgi:hypothetical protein